MLQKQTHLKELVTAALFTAFTCVATMVIQIPTPAVGYIHPGDALVLLSGVILGPLTGGLAAGIGSMLADVFSGYLIYAIPTLVIKFVTAAIAGLLFERLRHLQLRPSAAFAAAALAAECNMVFGYFVNKIVQTLFLAGNAASETLAAGLANALADLLPNAVQGLTGIVLGLALLPILSRVPDVRLWMSRTGMP